MWRYGVQLFVFIWLRKLLEEPWFAPANLAWQMEKLQFLPRRVSQPQFNVCARVCVWQRERVQQWLWITYTQIWQNTSWISMCVMHTQSHAQSNLHINIQHRPESLHGACQTCYIRIYFHIVQYAFDRLIQIIDKLRLNFSFINSKWSIVSHSKDHSCLGITIWNFIAIKPPTPNCIGSDYW